MSTITKERVAGIASGEKCYTHDDVVELARIALASLEAEPVAYVMADDLKDGSIISTPAYRDLGEAMERTVGDVVALYAAPPAPVSVPDERAAFNAWNNDTDCPLAGRDAKTAAWLAWCRRAAMLQGAENAESRCSKSPVISDGWVMVPVEPTEHMIVEGFESEPDEFFSDAEVWETYDAMSGCQQAAHRAKLCWAAMLAAAPKPEA